jgi:hypothetical protein
MRIMRGSCDKELDEAKRRWGLVASLFSTLGLLCLLVLQAESDYGSAGESFHHKYHCVLIRLLTVGLLHRFVNSFV